MKRNKIHYSLMVVALMWFGGVHAQEPTGINTSSPDADSDLTLGSTDKGLLLNRVALANTASPSPLTGHVQGMVVYNSAIASITTKTTNTNSAALTYLLPPPTNEQIQLLNSVKYLDWK